MNTEDLEIPIPEDRPWDSPRVLVHLHHHLEMTTSEMADLLGCTGANIKYHMNKHNVEARRFHKERPWTDEDTLRRLYVEEGLSQQEVGDRLGCSASTIGNWMDKFGIKNTHFVNRAKFRTQQNGYEQWCSTYGWEKDRLYVHQLLAVAMGTDPHDLFGGDYQIHHKNGIHWDNRPGNIETIHIVDHASEHMNKKWGDKPWRNEEMLEKGLKKYTVSKLADLWGCSPRTIRDWKNRHGLPDLKPGRQPDKVELTNE